MDGSLGETRMALFASERAERFPDQGPMPRAKCLSLTDLRCS